MGVGVDDAGQDQGAAGIELAGGGGAVGTGVEVEDGLDAAIDDADVTREGAVGGDDGAAANEQVQRQLSRPR